MGLFDRNKDNEISVAEYLESLKLHDQVNNKKSSQSQLTDEDDLITVTTRTGKQKKMSKKSFLLEMRESLKGFALSDDGEVKRQIDKTEKITKVMEDDPAMGRFIKIGQYIHSELIKHEYYSNSTILSQLRSLPPGGSINRGKETTRDLIPSKGNFTVWLEMSIKMKDSILTSYEAKVEFHPAKYYQPSIFVDKLWLLDNNGQRIRQLKLPTIGRIRWSWKWLSFIAHKGMTSGMISYYITSLIFLIGLLLLSTKWLFQNNELFDLHIIIKNPSSQFYYNNSGTLNLTYLIKMATPQDTVTSENENPPLV
eukprot:gene11558-15478_t